MQTYLSALGVIIVLNSIVYSTGSSIDVIANFRGRRYPMTCDTASEVCARVEAESGVAAAEQAVMFRGKIIRPGDKLTAAGISVGDTINVIQRRKQQFTDNTEDLKNKKNPSGEGLDEARADMVKKLAQTLNPEGVDMAMKALQGVAGAENIDKLFDEKQMELVRLQALEHIDEYDKLMPGMKAQIEAIASSPKLWSASVLEAKQVLKQLLANRSDGVGSSLQRGGAESSTIHSIKKDVISKHTAKSKATKKKRENDKLQGVR